MENESQIKRAFCYACFPKTSEAVDDALMTACINEALPQVNTYVVKSFVDVDNKKQPKNRPNWNAMIEECQEENINLIVLPEVAMLAHNTMDAILYAKEAKRKYGVDMYFLIERLDTASENADERLNDYLMLQEQFEQQQKRRKKLRKLFRELGEVMDADGKSRRNYDYYGSRFV